MSLDRTYSIQSADLSVVEGAWKTPQGMISLYDSYDWNQELELEKTLEKQGKECCPSGLILVRTIGVFFHLCPLQDGRVNLYCVLPRPRKILGVFNITINETLAMEKVSQSFARHALTKFMADDKDWLQKNIKED